MEAEPYNGEQPGTVPQSIHSVALKEVSTVLLPSLAKGVPAVFVVFLLPLPESQSTLLTVLDVPQLEVPL